MFWLDDVNVEAVIVIIDYLPSYLAVFLDYDTLSLAMSELFIYVGSIEKIFRRFGETRCQLRLCIIVFAWDICVPSVYVNSTLSLQTILRLLDRSILAEAFNIPMVSRLMVFLVNFS